MMFSGHREGLLCCRYWSFKMVTNSRHAAINLDLVFELFDVTTNICTTNSRELQTKYKGNRFLKWYSYILRIYNRTIIPCNRQLHVVVQHTWVTQLHSKHTLTGMGWLRC